MAIMVPNNISPDIKSNAEKRIFKWFKESSGTEDWIILHSLGISSHQRVIHGEIDFLVLAPGLGIFALEVKGGRVRRTFGKWQFINRYDEVNEKIRGPFDQAWEGIYSVRASLRRNIDTAHQHLKNVIFGIGVMFPDIEYESVGVDEEAWQVFDINDGIEVKSYIERLAQGAKVTFERLGYPVTSEMFPSNDDVRYLFSLLRGDFDQDVPLKIKQKYAEEEFLELTSEQSRCIEQLKDNPRVLICGTAGTGKTLLAIEAVKRFAAEGESVALFCYNRLLGAWMEDYFADLPSEQRPTYVGTFHRYMGQVLTDNNVHFNDSGHVSDIDDYFKNEVPEMFLGLSSETISYFDRIIVDEAQDLFSERYLDVMDRCLINGLAKGSWIMFGDFSKQSIYSNDTTESQLIEQIQKKSFFALFRLTQNCRNTRKICLAIENILGIPENAAFEDGIDVPYVDYREYLDIEDQKLKLVNLINDLLEKSIQKKDIVILSPRKFDDSVVKLIEGIDIVAYSVGETEEIRFCTLQAFKGLESSTVVMTDIESYENEKLIYVGLSRARFDLHVFETSEAAEARRRLFIERRLK